jgi:hypothetical protein
MSSDKILKKNLKISMKETSKFKRTSKAMEGFGFEIYVTGLIILVLERILITK